MDELVGLRLIENLKDEPEKFYNEGKSYELLQEYFKGFSKDTLRALFYCEDKWIRRAAIWITSELGVEGSELIKEVLTQLNDIDNYICSYAIEIVANCAGNEYIDDFMSIFSFFEHTEQKIRISVMNIISNLSNTRIKEACSYLMNKKTTIISMRKDFVPCLILTYLHLLKLHK